MASKGMAAPLKKKRVAFYKEPANNCQQNSWNTNDKEQKTFLFFGNEIPVNKIKVLSRKHKMILMA